MTLTLLDSWLSCCRPCSYSCDLGWHLSASTWAKHFPPMRARSTPTSLGYNTCIACSHTAITGEAQQAEANSMHCPSWPLMIRSTQARQQSSPHRDEVQILVKWCTLVSWNWESKQQENLQHLQCQNTRNMCRSGKRPTRTAPDAAWHSPWNGFRGLLNTVARLAAGGFFWYFFRLNKRGWNGSSWLRKDVSGLSLYQTSPQRRGGMFSASNKVSMKKDWRKRLTKTY